MMETQGWGNQHCPILGQTIEMRHTQERKEEEGRKNFCASDHKAVGLNQFYITNVDLERKRSRPLN